VLKPPSADTPATAPTLILAPRTVASQGTGQDSTILGLGLTERAALAARRASYGRPIALPAANAVPGTAPFPGWQYLAKDLGGSTGMLVIAASDILAETGWLKATASAKLNATQWAAAPDRLALIPAMLIGAALSALDEEPRALSLAMAVDRLTQRLGAPSPLPPGIDPLVVTGPGDVRAAERRLMLALVKDTDGFMAKHVERPISLAISRLLAPTPVTPNQMTLISVAIGLLGAPFFLSSQAHWQTLGALLFLAHSILDGCDGELARLKFMESRWGGILDFWGDNVVHSAIFACMALGWSEADGQAWPLLLGVAAVMGTLGSAGFVYWRVMRPKTGSGPLYTSVAAEPGKRFAQALDALSRRDFIYLVIALALFGRADWFLLLSAFGAPIFFFLLVFLAARERRAQAKVRQAI
jgi:phosphatidylglycerophosphate synthase